MFQQFVRLSKHSLTYSIGAAASIISFLLLPLYTRYLSPSDYGILEIFSATSSVLLVLFSLGIAGGLFLPSYYQYEDEQKKNAVISTTIIFITATSLLFTLILLTQAERFSSAVFQSDQYAFYFQIIFMAIFCNTGVAIAFAVFRVREQPFRYTMFLIGKIIATIGLNVLLIVYFRKGVLGILQADLIVVGIMFCFLIPHLLKNTGLKFSAPDLKAMLAFGLPYVPSNLFAWVMNLSDRYFLKYFSNLTELGLYSMGYKFGMLIQLLIVAPFTLAWGPFLWSVSKEKNAREIYSRVLTYFILAGMFLVLAISVLSREVLMVMTTPEFYGAERVIPLIALSYILLGSFSIVAVGISLEMKTGYVPLVIGVGAVINLELNTILIPSQGMMGAAIATFISYLVLPVYMYFISRRYYPIKYEQGRIAKIFIAAALIYVVGIRVEYESVLVTGLIKTAALLTFPFVLYLFKFFQTEEIAQGREFARLAPAQIKKIWEKISTRLG